MTRDKRTNEATSREDKTKPEFRTFCYTTDPVSSINQCYENYFKKQVGVVMQGMFYIKEIRNIM